ncbi:glycosyltransferase family 4 protein [Sediminicola sp. 1XM1-17]|uniref:glycosyltransferase family 4 protein n=1 Tax=Sediminicola sp. 1XM1-17 TaxID=3127702 RepID=UPI003077DAF2
MKKKVLRVAAIPGSLAGLLNGQLRYLNQYYEVIGLASEGKRHKDLRKNENIRTIPVNISRRISPFQDLVSLYKLYIIFRKEKPFLVHSITPKAGLLSMVAAYLARVPHRAHTFTGLIFPTKEGFMKKILIFFDKIICICATNVYPEGQGVKNDLINYNITKKSLKIIANGNVNGVDIRHFDPSLFPQKSVVELRTKYNYTLDDFVFLFVGRIVNDKGIIELINAFTQLEAIKSNIKLLLVGTFESDLDPIPSHIENEIQSNPNILHVGHQNDVRPFFALSNILVLPSYREGFPNVILQAGAMGKYCIVTDINGSNEIIKNGENGAIIPVKNSFALMEQMKYCLEHKTNYAAPNDSYRQIIVDKFEQQIVWEALLKEYKSMEIKDIK